VIGIFVAEVCNRGYGVAMFTRAYFLCADRDRDLARTWFLLANNPHKLFRSCSKYRNWSRYL